MSKKMQLLELILSFLKIGSIAFGGGYSVFPLLQKEAIEKRKWLNDDELMDIMAIAQVLPGVLYVNAATLVGYRLAGFWGALLATIAGILPTLILTMIIVLFFWDYTNLVVIQKAVTGILVGVTALILYSIKKMWKSAILTKYDIVWVVIATIALVFFKFNAALLVILLGVIIFIFNYRFVSKGV